MPAFLIQQGATVICAHGGTAQPAVPSPRVKIGGMPALLVGDPWAVSGCAHLPPPTGNGPCVSAQWLSGTLRVTSGGKPLLIQSGSSLCIPTSTPLSVVIVQNRVQAT